MRRMKKVRIYPMILDSKFEFLLLGRLHPSPDNVTVNCIDLHFIHKN